MSHQWNFNHGHRRAAYAGVGVLAVLATAVLGSRVMPGNDTAGNAVVGHSVPSLSAHAEAGHKVAAKVYRKPPPISAEDRERLQEEMNEEEDGVVKGHIVPVHHPQVLNRGAVSPGSVQNAATTIVRDSAIPASGIKGGTGYESFVQEPSTDAFKTHIFQTGNWYATRSLNNGATWSYLDPFTLFGSGFCCDQVTRFDKLTQKQFWLLQYDDHLVVANASSAGATGFTNWCYYEFDATSFGLPAGTALDYNDMLTTNSFITISTNFFASTSGSAMARFPRPQ